MSFVDDTNKFVVEIAGALRDQDRQLVTVESCTGGMIGSALTALTGISDVYAGGFITYSNESKHQSVGVLQSSLDLHGAVSSQVALEMAMGGQSKLHASNSISVTGIAGPGGATAGKPVGTVWICVSCNSGMYDTRRFLFSGDRHSVREQAALSALHMKLQMLSGADAYEKLESQEERLTSTSYRI